MKIIEKIKNYGILVIRALFGKRGVSKAGAIVIGLGVFFGVSQASSIADAFARMVGQGGATHGESIVETKASSKNALSAVVAEPAAKPANDEPTSSALNIVDLIGQAETIVRGGVVNVTDGFEKGVPYTEITLQVSESIRGNFGETMTFRQFGLIAPRKMEDGTTNLMVTPAGWAKYASGEDVMLFLNPSGRLTGLRAPVGLAQGKFDTKGGNAMNETANLGLFDGVEMDEGLKTDRDKRLLVTKKGPVNADSLASFVRRAVKDRWIEGGKLRHAKK